MLNNQRKLFCEISPLTYQTSVIKNIIIRCLKDFFSFEKFSKVKRIKPLNVLVYKHNSLILRKLGNSNISLQYNKANNLSIAAPKVTNILIKPGETFSFWKVVGCCTKRKGYKEGLVICSGSTDSGVGGGMCQFTNLIHWMILHSPLTITEHHHHDSLDLFPDFGRQVPFGTGTSIAYNYLDYRFKNNTDCTFQLIIYVNDKYLCGELRSDVVLKEKYHVKVEDEYFSIEGDDIYRNNKIYLECVDKASGNLLKRELIKTNHSKVMYDKKYIPSDSFLNNTNLKKIPKELN